MVTRIQHGTAEHLSIASGLAEGNIGQAPAQDAPSTQVHTGAVRYTAGQAEAKGESVTRHTLSFSGTAGGSVASTLQNVNGRSTVELIPGDPSSRTVVQTALRDGLIQRNAAGQFEDVAPQSPVQPADGANEEPQQDNPQDNPDAAAFDPEADNLWAQDIAPLPQHAYDAAVASTIGLLVNGKGSVEQTARDFAERAGLEPSQAEEFLDAGLSYYSAQVVNALAPMGITGDRLNEYRAFIATQPGKYQDSIQKLVHMRDLSGFKELAVGFRRGNPGPEVAMLKGAGMQTAQDPHTGETLYRRGTGPWVTMAQLAAGK